jgi:hypothetical protein
MLENSCRDVKWTDLYYVHDDTDNLCVSRQQLNGYQRVDVILDRVAAEMELLKLSSSYSVRSEKLSYHTLTLL